MDCLVINIQSLRDECVVCMVFCFYEKFVFCNIIISRISTMPYLYQTTGRRQFIKTLAGGVGAIATMGVFSSFVKDENKSLRFAFFSDTHIPADKDNHYRGFYMVKNLKKIVPQIVESEVHSAIITGDLARLEGKQEDYKKLKQLLDPLAGKIPVAMALGNHDRRDHFLEVFPVSPGERQDV
ncbi:MAG TPA: hypothetical protein ENK25_04035, partial [Bacteroidetes bacterium]|nr:hypothetical protein [Bacteroidota bacterium]